MFPLYCTKNLVSGSLLLRLLTFSRCCSFFLGGGYRCDLLPRDYFIQRLVYNTGGPLSWILIFSPDLLIFLESHMKGLPVTGRIENRMHRMSLESQFYVVTVHSYGILGLCRYRWIFDTNDNANFPIFINVYV